MSVPSTLQHVRIILSLFLILPQFPLTSLIKTQSHESDHFSCTVTEHQTAAFMELLGKFQKHSPGFQGPVQPKDSIPKVMKVWEDASLEKGSGGAFLSHTGVPGRWL